jgi:hypothetical protein
MAMADMASTLLSVTSAGIGRSEKKVRPKLLA